ncbi:MAG: hypothetical protein EZS28_046359, partial [Streblomastix strix]
IIPIFIKFGLLDVVLRLVTTAEGLQSLALLIPILEDIKLNGECIMSIQISQSVNNEKKLMFIMKSVMAVNGFRLAMEDFGVYVRN